ncbi:hypothetical protein D9758_002429 [Tetrapyrgos nigripes]|uniref:Protein kinase domain-containing protein n=1 Tax=Tetrapyrgos nigripes TaxID=182062 RepID=A0A8H5LT22_9AGAR|nr:hypothetical protein D9758_002429 [Tetrapyrgos nigripes]
MTLFNFTGLDTSVDRNSNFFKALTAPLVSTPTRPLNWPSPALPRSPTHEINIASILESIHASKSSGSRPPLSDNAEPESPRKKLRLSEHASKTLYQPSGKWEWIKDLPLVDKESTFLSDGAMCNAYIKKGEIGGKEITYVCKSWRTSVEWDGGFYLEMGLYKTHLRPLQGVVVPYIISLFTAPGLINVIMEPPHHSFWIEASTDMPLVLKQRCVEAFEKLHERGVLHGDVELRHMLIGGDARVTLIDFQESGALVPVGGLEMRRVSEGELKRELRKVKVKLDYPGAREEEYERFQQYAKKRSNGQADNMDDMNNPPVKSLQEWNDWIAVPGNDGKPKRFVVPGQTPGTIFEEIQTFLTMIDTSSVVLSTSDSSYLPKAGGDVDAPLSQEAGPSRSASGSASALLSRSASFSRKPSLHSSSSTSSLASGHRLGGIDSGSNVRLNTSAPDRHISSQSATASTSAAATPSSASKPSISALRTSILTDSQPPPPIPATRIQPAQYPVPYSSVTPPINDRGQSDNSPSVPSARALGKRKADAEPDVDDEDSRAPKRRLLTPVPSNVSVGRNPPCSQSSDVIGMKNLADCIANQLPHPTLLELFPNNPRWQQPDVQYYLKEQTRDMQRVIEAAKRYPDRHFRAPRPIRSFGPLKRKMEEIRSVLRGHYGLAHVHSGPNAAEHAPERHDGINGVEYNTGTNSAASVEPNVVNPSSPHLAPCGLNQGPGWYGVSVHWLRGFVRLWGEGAFV